MAVSNLFFQWVMVLIITIDNANLPGPPQPIKKVGSMKEALQGRGGKSGHVSD